MTSSPPSEHDISHLAELFTSNVQLTELLPELYAENIIAKALRTAQSAMGALPEAFPEIVPQDSEHNGRYSLREAEFWTCGFFLGTLYAILERLIRFPRSLQLHESINLSSLRSQLATLCHTWTEPIYGMDCQTDTHGIGFIIMPALRAGWEMFGNQRSLDSIAKAARSLAMRYVPSAKAIRSWDLLKKKDIEIIDQNNNMIIIIDSMLNLDLLYYAAYHAQDSTLSDMATAHAETVLRSHFCHVANLDPKNGDLKLRLTAQGYDHDSTWSRGLAWGILGHAETYVWTKKCRFLEVAHVPLWDFDAPIENENEPLRDSSAGVNGLTCLLRAVVIAANGMLILSQALASTYRYQHSLAARFRKAAIGIVDDTLKLALASEKALLVLEQYQQIQAKEVEPGRRFDGMLKAGTANNNVNARKRYANHGLVYGDYYLVEFGNKLFRMSLC
ncbi:Six-hairpin glycosidase [Setomelanomma holmii]|uniref:Six-hairpin glycosidase n=1 Tax=Setomelanomma holmii TaxID=210430 RepID=A0A9P4H0I2_9PLEO|nr:Six-hairpin glycosidase [Setomelanomma holmii]